MSDYCQRWRERRHSWRHRSEGGFDSRRYEVAAIAESTARTFVERHHYSGCYPASRFRFGLYSGPWLVGVAVLSVPVQRSVLTIPFPGLAPYRESLELGRFVLLDAVPANAESWFLARVFEIASHEGIRGIVSFSDPVQRTTSDGSVVMPGHIGTIYQASNATYLGRSTARTLLVLPDGTILSARAVSKLQAGDRGHAYVERQLIQFGAPALADGQDRREWTRVALAAVGVRRVRHHGNHRYAFALGGPAARRSLQIGLVSAPYPKALDSWRPDAAREAS